MSLVHDALQKAEREKLRKTGEIAPPRLGTTGSGVGSDGRRPSGAAKPVVAPPGLSAGDPEPAAARGPAPVPPRSATAVTDAASRRSVVPFLLVGIMAIAVGVFVWAALRPPPAREGGVPPPLPAPAESVAPARETPAERPPEPGPAPAPVPAAADSGYKLTGIMNNPDGTPSAILNGRVVSEGNYVEGAVVKKIERDRVTLDVNGREIVKRLY